MAYDVEVTVVSQEGRCGAGHKVGDSWTFDQKSPEGLCLAAMSPILPFVWALRFKGEFPWAEDKDVQRLACPDSRNPVVFELKRQR